MKPGPRPQCECGECRTCYLRIIRRRFYERHAEQVKQQTAAAKQKRRNNSPEVSDEEMDRRALILMGRTI